MCLSRLVTIISVFSFSTAAGWCQSQLDWMTLSEVERVLEQLPEFGPAASSPGCPGFLVFNDAASRILSLQLRGFCPVEVKGSTTVKNYAFDRSTGQLLDWASGQPTSDLPVEVRALTRTLLKVAKARALSETEARCVASSALAEEIAGKDIRLVIETKGRPSGSMIEFPVEQRTSSPKRIIGWTLVVDLSNAAVLESSTGTILNYASTNDLLSNMRTIREPVELTALEAIDVATRTPTIAAELSGDCPPKVTSAYGTSVERFITLEDVCKDHPIYGRTIAAVNIANGLVTDIATKMPLSTPESTSVANDLLRRHRDRRTRAQAYNDRACDALRKPGTDQWSEPPK